MNPSPALKAWNQGKREGKKRAQLQKLMAEEPKIIAGQLNGMELLRIMTTLSEARRALRKCLPKVQGADNKAAFDVRTVIWAIDRIISEGTTPKGNLAPIVEGMSRKPGLQI